MNLHGLPFKKILLFFLASSSLMAPALPYQKTWDDLWPQILQKNQLWETLALTTTVEVFDPFHEEAPTPEAAQPPQSLPAWGYAQKIYWKSEELLAIETFDSSGALLHFYYESKGDVVNVATQKERPFLKMDLLPHYLLFIVKRAKDWKNALQAVHIQDNAVSLHHDETFNIFYRIGEPHSAHFALVDKQNLLLKSLHYSLPGKEKMHSIEIVFKKMTGDQTLEYPQQTDYWIDNRLFKRVTVDSLQSPAQLPLESLRKKAAQWSKQAVLSLDVDYTQ